jgi:hypothetical protein
MRVEIRKRNTIDLTESEIEICVEADIEKKETVMFYEYLSTLIEVVERENN